MELNEICIYIYTRKYLQVVIFVVYGVVCNMGYPSATISIYIVFLLHPQHLVLSINTSSKYICNHIPF